jgi:RNase P subunit RPR2
MGPIPHGQSRNTPARLFDLLSGHEDRKHADDPSVADRRSRHGASRRDSGATGGSGGYGRDRRSRKCRESYGRAPKSSFDYLEPAVYLLQRTSQNPARKPMTMRYDSLLPVRAQCSTCPQCGKPLQLFLAGRARLEDAQRLARLILCEACCDVGRADSSRTTDAPAIARP